MAVVKLEIWIPEKLWQKLDEMENKTGVRKEDIFIRAVINLVEGYRCPKCGFVVKEFKEIR
jgi:metal-responsive CopG/Arc/MetJ family transcriptional regulator